MAYNNKKVMKCCSINICGLSDKSRPLVNKYVHDENIDVLMVQETMSVNQDNISLTSMKMKADDKILALFGIFPNMAGSFQFQNFCFPKKVIDVGRRFFRNKKENPLDILPSIIPLGPLSTSKYFLFRGTTMIVDVIQQCYISQIRGFVKLTR